MHRRFLRTFVLSVALLAMLRGLPATAGSGDWLAGIGLGQSQPDTAHETFEAVAAYIAELPAKDDRIALAAAATDIGHWRLVNRAGEPFTAAGDSELARGFSTLAPQSDGQPRRLDIYLTADTIFRHREQIGALPATAQLRTLVSGHPRPIFRHGTGKSVALWIEVTPSLLIEAGERALFDETLWQLERPIARSRVRTLSLEPGGPTVLSRAPAIDIATRRAVADRIEPASLAQALGGLGGGIALATGRVDRDHLAFTPESGRSATMALSDLALAASRADANLIVLATSSARQPGTRNWLWQRVELGNIDQAIDRTSLGAFLTALIGQGEQTVAHTRRLGGTHVVMELVPAGSMAGGPVGSVTEKVSETWSDIVTETAGKVGVTGIQAIMLSHSRQAELDRRLVPGIASPVQFVLTVLTGLGLITLPTLLGWWRRLWLAEAAGDYGSWAGLLLARGVRCLLFAVLFLPLAAIPAVLWRLAGSVGLTSAATGAKPRSPEDRLMT